MPEQFLLPGFMPWLPPTDRLFFAIMPPADIAAKIAGRAKLLREQLGLKSRPHVAGRLHITVAFLGDYVGLPPQLVTSAMAAAEQIDAAQFEVSFDRVASFGSWRGKRPNPVVLLAAPGADAIQPFRQILVAALSGAGLARPEPSFTPHMTLLYDSQTVPATAVEPVGWPVREFVLIHSTLGKTRYTVLGRWALREVESMQHEAAAVASDQSGMRA